jgi:hypothetical protein
MADGIRELFATDVDGWSEQNQIAPVPAHAVHAVDSV